MDDRRRDGGTNSTLRTKEQGTHLTLNEHDDDDDGVIIFTVLATTQFVSYFDLLHTVLYFICMGIHFDVFM